MNTFDKSLNQFFVVFTHGNCSFCRGSYAIPVVDLQKLIFITMHIIVSNLLFKLDAFLWRTVYMVKLKGRFGCGVAVVLVNVKMELRNLQKEC